MPKAEEIAALLRWQIEAGADEAVGETPLDRLSQGPDHPAPAQTSAQASTRTPAQAPRAGGGPTMATPELPPEPQTPPEMPKETPELPGIPALPTVGPATHPGKPMATGGGTSHATPHATSHGAPHGARALAAAAETLEELHAALSRFDECALKKTATNMVFADGNPAAPVVFIGEAPGAEEDRRGLPFVGRAGKLLDRMLAAIGRDRDSAYITNILFWRPPGNRQPTAGEIAACLPFVERHIELLAPQALVFLGGTAAKTLLGRREGIMRLRGRWFEYSSPGLGRPVAAMATFHPAYLLRSPGQKRAAWQDLLAVKERLDSTAGTP